MYKILRLNPEYFFEVRLFFKQIPLIFFYKSVKYY